MAAGVPPPPLNSPTGSFYWLQWYSTLTNFLNGQNIPWSNLNFSGSNIADIVTRDHNSLTHIEGGSASGTYPSTGHAFHLIGAEYVGQVAAAGTAIQLPAGWTTAGGVVTHNLNLIPTAYTVMVIALNGTPTTSSVQLSANTFQAHFGASTNWAFVLCQGS